jgi:hypothetical protein
VAYEPNSLLGRLVGSRLLAVEFVLDYLQLRFDGASTEQPILTCEVMPIVAAAGREYPPASSGWADALRALIGKDVLGTRESTGTGIAIDFAAGSILLHPAQDDLVGPEIAMLRGFDDGAWMAWRPGENSFEDL